MEEQILGERRTLSPLLVSLELNLPLQKVQEDFVAFFNSNRDVVDARFVASSMHGDKRTLSIISSEEYDQNSQNCTIISLSPRNSASDALTAALNYGTCKAVCAASPSDFEISGIFSDSRHDAMSNDVTGLVGPAADIWNQHLAQAEERLRIDEERRKRVEEERQKRMERAEAKKQPKKPATRKNRKTEQNTLTQMSTKREATRGGARPKSESANEELPASSDPDIANRFGGKESSQSQNSVIDDEEEEPQYEEPEEELVYEEPVYEKVGAVEPVHEDLVHVRSENAPKVQAAPGESSAELDVKPFQAKLKVEGLPLTSVETPAPVRSVRAILKEDEEPDQMQVDAPEPNEGSYDELLEVAKHNGNSSGSEDINRVGSIEPIVNIPDSEATRGVDAFNDYKPISVTRNFDVIEVDEDGFEIRSQNASRSSPRPNQLKLSQQPKAEPTSQESQGSENSQSERKTKPKPRVPKMGQAAIQSFFRPAKKTG